MISRFWSKTGEILHALTVLLPSFLLGGSLYFLLEVAYRGHTHPVMALVGGLGTAGLKILSEKYAGRPLVWRALIGMVFLTALEFSVGCVFNLMLGMRLWSYRGLRIQLFGQISLLYSVFWFFLSLPVLFFFQKRKEFRAKKEKFLPM